MTLSIIIAVLNNEKLVRTCLDSVLNCDLNDCEILLAEGISSDRSNEVCSEYQQKWPFIHVVMQNGKGLSNARNCAMQYARGDYLLFLDADDYVESSVLSSLIDRLRSGALSMDLLITDFYRVLMPSRRVIPFFQIGADTEEQTNLSFLPNMLKKRQAFWNVWRFIYRRSFLEAHHIQFMENRLSEDVDFTTSVFLANPSVVFSHSPYYYYHVGRGASLMDRITLKRLEDAVFLLSKSVARLRTSDFSYAADIIAQYQFEYILQMAMVVEVKKEDRSQAASFFNDWKTVLEDSIDPFVRFAVVFLSLFDIWPTAFVLHVLKLFRRKIYRK